MISTIHLISEMAHACTSIIELVPSIMCASERQPDLLMCWSCMKMTCHHHSCLSLSKWVGKSTGQKRNLVNSQTHVQKA